MNGEMPEGIEGSFNLCDVCDLVRGTSLAETRGSAATATFWATRK